MKELKREKNLKEKYSLLNNIYDKLISVGYSFNESHNFVKKCGVLESHGQSLKPKVPIKKIKECLREARKERRMY